MLKINDDQNLQRSIHLVNWKNWQIKSKKKKKEENLANRCSYSYEKHVYKKKSYEKHVIVRLVMNGFAWFRWLTSNMILIKKKKKKTSNTINLACFTVTVLNSFLWLRNIWTIYILLDTRVTGKWYFHYNAF